MSIAQRPNLPRVHRLTGPWAPAWGSGARRWAGALLLGLGLAGCGGSNPLDNPPDVENPDAAAGQKLSFAYYQKCINPIFLELLPIPGTTVTNTCAAGGCHDVFTGSGGSFRINQGATDVAIGSPPDAAAIRLTDMYKNFKSAQGQVVFADPLTSRMVTKPLVRGVLHGGGRIFVDESDPKIQLLLYWMTHPAAQGQDEFTAPAPASC